MSILAKNFSLIIGFVILMTVVCTAIVSFFWLPYAVEDLNISIRLLSPSREHWLGTDHFGRDVFSMIMSGARNSLFAGIVAVFIGALLGVPLGMIAAINNRSSLDDLIMRSNDLVFAFPALVTAVILSSVFSPSLLNSVIAIGVFNIPVFARVTRGASLSVLQRQFIMAALCSGEGYFSISLRHILPNIIDLLLIQTAIQFAIAILAEAGLSYVGLGTQPPQVSWGAMLASAQTLIYISPWLAVFPGMAIFVTVLGLNFLADGLKQLFDVKSFAYK